MSESMQPIIPSNVFWSETDDGVVVVDPVNGDVRAFNGVGSEVWQGLSQKLTVGQIERELMEAYGISAEIAQRDVAAFLSELDKRGLIKWVAAAAT